MQADIERTNSLNSGHRACQGCGEALGARYAIDAAMRATGNQLIAANATGCLEVFSTPYPETSWQMPWIHSLFGNAAAVGTGIAAALQVKAIGGQGTSSVRVIAQGGDGGTTDIGFGCLSGMFERNDDVLYICYDNEAYMNTGVQRSSATPPAARTATTMAVGPTPGNAFGQGKNLPRIAMAHDIPYVATATVADLRDLERRSRGPWRCTARATSTSSCPARWAGAARAGHDQAGPAWPETGIFPVFEAEHGDVTQCHEDPHRVPVEEYLRPQKRFAHLFRSGRGSPTIVARIQPTADRNIASLRPARCGGAAHDNGQALRHHAGRRLVASPTRPASWRTERPVYVDRLPPCNAAVSGRRGHPGLAVPRRVRRLRAAWRHLTRDNPFPAIMGRVCYHSCETRMQPGKLDEAVGINSVERFLGDEALKEGLAV